MKKKSNIRISCLLFEHNINNTCMELQTKNKPIVLEFGMFAESNWDVKNANAYVIIDDSNKKI